MSTIEERLAEMKQHTPNLDYFIKVSGDPFAEATALERQYSAKFLEGEIRHGKLHVLMMPVKQAGDVELFIDVWNCQHSLAQRVHHTITRLKVPPRLENKLSKIATTIIEKENDGAINISGQYYAKTAKSAGALLDVFMETGPSEHEGEAGSDGRD